MTKLLLKLPWFLSAPIVTLLAAAFAAAGYMYTGDYFHETCRNERNLLTGEFEASNCGEGAKVARQSDAPSNDQSTGSTPVNATGTADAGAGTVLATGTFRDGDPGHTGKGTAQVQRLRDGRLNLFLRDFSVTNGPDLFVYLVERGGRDQDGLNLGELQANNGNQNYAIPAGTDLAKYDRVAIWCRQFRVNFAFAPLSGASIQAAAQPTATAAASPAQTATSTVPATAQPSATPAAPPATPTAVPATPTPRPVPSTGAGVLATGHFRDGDPGHQGSGTAQVQRLADGKLNLFLSNFAVTNGPDLVVVLSTDPAGSRGSVSSGLTLGALKANNGNQNYAIPAGTDIAQFKSVIIWCKSFPTVFAYATLEAS